MYLDKSDHLSEAKLERSGRALTETAAGCFNGTLNVTQFFIQT